MGMDRHYKLVGHEAVPCSVHEWAVAFEGERRGERIVERTERDGVVVSTVFLGTDHSFSTNPNAPPLIFETMTFGGPFDQGMERYSTWDQAVEGHNRAVEEAFAWRLECQNQKKE